MLHLLLAKNKNKIKKQNKQKNLKETKTKKNQHHINPTAVHGLYLHQGFWQSPLFAAISLNFRAKHYKILLQRKVRTDWTGLSVWMMDLSCYSASDFIEEMETIYQRWDYRVFLVNPNCLITELTCDMNQCQALVC